ncbi:MAG: response regulator [Candidatus Omnitrophota bacterium]
MRSGNSVLIIDDDPEILNLLIDIFLKEGFYRAMGTVTGEDVNSLISKKNPDVILLDVHIKGEDSIALLKDIKRENKSLPVVMLSDEDDKELAKKSLALGASSYVIKTTASSDIVKNVKKELDRSITLRIDKKISILIVDDDKMSADMVNSFLKGEGYNCSVSYNPKKALGMVKAHKPKLIFSDIVMPGMDGIEFLSRVKDIDKDIKVVMMTGVADKNVCTDAILKGASGYITKPFSLQQLRVSVVTALLVE